MSVHCSNRDYSYKLKKIARNMKERMQNISYITGTGRKKFVECDGNDTK
jgi:hypothetical protein